MHLVTQSLFPPFSISCEPICAAAVTARRLMAGYVIYHSGDDVATDAWILPTMHLTRYFSSLEVMPKYYKAFFAMLGRLSLSQDF